MEINDIKKIKYEFRREIDTYNYGHLERFAEEIGVREEDICTMLGIYGKDRIEKLKKREVPLRKAEKAALYFLDGLYEQKQLFANAIRVRLRSYWCGYRDAGGKVPKDVMKKHLIMDDDIPTSLKDYRRGVLDFKEENLIGE